MRTKNLHPRLPATALCLCALVLAASPPAFAQNLWEAQDQADMWGRLQAQGLIRSPDAARAAMRPRTSAFAAGRSRTSRSWRGSLKTNTQRATGCFNASSSSNA